MTIKETYNRLKKKWTRLTNLVSTTETNKIMIILVSFKMVFQLMYIQLIQCLNSTVRIIDKNTFEVTYVISSKSYKLLVNPYRGPDLILQISDDSGVDVTDRVLPYMGPNYDWHKQPLDPMFFDSAFLTFQMADGTEQTVFTNIQSTKQVPLPVPTTEPTTEPTTVPRRPSYDDDIDYEYNWTTIAATLAAAALCDVPMRSSFEEKIDTTKND